MLLDGFVAGAVASIIFLFEGTRVPDGIDAIGAWLVIAVIGACIGIVVSYFVTALLRAFLFKRHDIDSWKAFIPVYSDIVSITDMGGYELGTALAWFALSLISLVISKALTTLAYDSMEFIPAFGVACAGLLSTGLRFWFGYAMAKTYKTRIAVAFVMMLSPVLAEIVMLASKDDAPDDDDVPEYVSESDITGSVPAFSDEGADDETD